MRGHIVKRYKNSHSIVLSLGRDPATGRSKQQWISVKGTKKDAEKRLAELVHQLDTGTFLKPSRATLGEFLDTWLADFVRPNLAPRTAEGYEHIIRRHLIPALGSSPLTRVKPEHLQRYYSEKLATGRIDGAGGLSPCTVRHHHMVLHMALGHAVKWGLLSRNPADAVDPPRGNRLEMSTLDEDGMYALLEAARDTPYHALFYLALYTGMRRSELLALRWRDVDLVLSQVHVHRSLHQLRDGKFVFRQPKTAKGRRTVALPPSAAMVLRDHHAKQEAERILLGAVLTDDGLVFARVDGTPLLPNTVTHAWIKLVRRLRLGSIRFHDARHSHASLLLKQGIHPKVVQERLGHSSIAMTLDTYSHVAPGLQEAAANRFDEMVVSRREKEAV